MARPTLPVLVTLRPRRAPRSVAPKEIAAWYVEVVAKRLAPAGVVLDFRSDGRQLGEAHALDARFLKSRSLALLQRAVVPIQIGLAIRKREEYRTVSQWSTLLRALT